MKDSKIFMVVKGASESGHSAIIVLTLEIQKSQELSKIKFSAPSTSIFKISISDIENLSITL